MMGDCYFGRYHHTDWSGTGAKIRQVEGIKLLNSVHNHSSPGNQAGDGVYIDVPGGRDLWGATDIVQTAG